MSTVLTSLNQSLHDLMESSPLVYVLGEDILDPYGGAFKVTRGLSTQFPARVLTTPISEAAIVGIATGMAMRGLRPIVEIMFGDFLSLAADQIANHASKFRWTYNDQVRVPIVVRTPMGGRRGYGPTHSQTLEKMFIGVPGLRTVAINTLCNPGKLLQNAVLKDNDPVLFIEHKLLYPRPLLQSGHGEMADFSVAKFGETYPTCILRFHGHHRSDLTIACYGYMFELVRQVALDLLLEYEFFSDIVLFSQLSPFEITPLLDSIKRSGRLLVVEEGGLTLGWGAEIVSRVVECKGTANLKAASRIAALDLPIATSRVLEDAILPSREDVLDAAVALVTR